MASFACGVRIHGALLERPCPMSPEQNSPLAIRAVPSDTIRGWQARATLPRRGIGACTSALVLCVHSSGCHPTEWCTSNNLKGGRYYKWIRIPGERSFLVWITRGGSDSGQYIHSLPLHLAPMTPPDADSLSRNSVQSSRDPKVQEVLDYLKKR